MKEMGLYSKAKSHFSWAFSINQIPIAKQNLFLEKTLTVKHGFLLINVMRTLMYGLRSGCNLVTPTYVK